MKRILMLLMFPIAAPIRLLFVSRDGKQTFWGRVGVFVTGSLVLSVINGNITFRAIGEAFRYLAMLCALILHYLGGYEVKAPRDVQNQGQDILGRIEAEAQEAKKKAAETAGKAEAKRLQDIHDAEIVFLKQKHDMEMEAIRIREAAEAKVRQNARDAKEELERKAAQVNPFAGFFGKKEEFFSISCPRCEFVNSFSKSRPRKSGTCRNCEKMFGYSGVGKLAEFRALGLGERVSGKCPECPASSDIIGNGVGKLVVCVGCKSQNYVFDWIEERKRAARVR